MRWLYIVSVGLVASGCMNETVHIETGPPRLVRSEYGSPRPTQRVRVAIDRRADAAVAVVTVSYVCDRIEHRESSRVEVREKRPSTGTYVTAAVLGGVGLVDLPNELSQGNSVSTNLVLIGAGPSVLIAALLSSGTWRRELPNGEQTSFAGFAECGSRPLPRASIEIRNGTVVQARTADDQGSASFDPLPAGRLEVFVNDVAVPDVIMTPEPERRDQGM